MSNNSICYIPRHVRRHDVSYHRGHWCHSGRGGHSCHRGHRCQGDRGGHSCHRGHRCHSGLGGHSCHKGCYLMFIVIIPPSLHVEAACFPVF